MTPDINFCLNGTRSIIVLRGTLKFWYNLTLPLIEAKLPPKNEQKGTVWIEQSGQTASWNYRRYNLWTFYSDYYWWMRHEFVWREDADPDVYVEISEEHVYDFDYDSLKSWIFVPSNLSAINTEKNLKWKLFGKGTFDYSRTNIPAPSTTTTTTTEGPGFFEQLFG